MVPYFDIICEMDENYLYTTSNNNFARSYIRFCKGRRRKGALLLFMAASAGGGDKVEFEI